MKNIMMRVLVVCCAVSLTACNRGFQSAADLESEQRGPKQCSASCESIGMKMAAFVLVEHSTSGCVCAPKEANPAPQDATSAASGEAAAVAGAHMVLEQQRRAAERQRQSTYTSQIH